jgi:hypothetical protein
MLGDVSLITYESKETYSYYCIFKRCVYIIEYKLHYASTI